MMNNAVILAGGQGKRMKADIPKPMFKVLEEPMLEWVIKACEEAELSNLCIVKGYGTKLHREKILELGPCPIHRPSFLNKIYAKK